MGAIRHGSEKEKAETKAQGSPQEANPRVVSTGIARPTKKENRERTEQERFKPCSNSGRPYGSPLALTWVGVRNRMAGNGRGALS